jgi:hypothetical protein
MPLSVGSFRLEAEFSESGLDQFQSEDQMLTIRRVLNNPITCVIAGWILGILPSSVQAQQPQQLAPVNVEARPYGEQLIGPYNQPRWSARGRFSANTDVYVLPPFSFYLDLDYHGTFPRVGKSDHLFTQELELGLPYRFQLAFELDEEHQNGRSQIPFTRIEGRWAPANWGKLPLNPTLLVEYDIGTGKQYPVQPGQNAEQEGGGDPIGDVVRQQASIPNSYELRLLLGQEIGTYIEFASNIFFDQDLWANREREIGFSTASSLAIRGEALKVGLETSYQNVSQPGARSKAQNIFELGPSFTVKPSPHTRIDLAPLFGVTNDSPHVDLFVIFSVDFGTGAAAEVESPAVQGGRH